MDVTGKIKHILSQRGWTAYRLAKESRLSESTIANIIKRNAIPSVDTLEAICNGMGITLSQFFADGELIEVTPKSIRLRKTILDTPLRKKAQAAKRNAEKQ